MNGPIASVIGVEKMDALILVHGKKKKFAIRHTPWGIGLFYEGRLQEKLHIKEKVK
jgi:hypothetical protein